MPQRREREDGGRDPPLQPVAGHVQELELAQRAHLRRNLAGEVVVGEDQPHHRVPHLRERRAEPVVAEVELVEEREPGELGHGAIEPVPRQHEALQRVHPREMLGDGAVEAVAGEVEHPQRLEAVELGARELAPDAERREREARQRREPRERGEERVGGEVGRQRGVGRAAAEHGELGDLPARARHGERRRGRQRARVRRPASASSAGGKPSRRRTQSSVFACDDTSGCAATSVETSTQRTTTTRTNTTPTRSPRDEREAISAATSAINSAIESLQLRSAMANQGRACA